MFARQTFSDVKRRARAAHAEPRLDWRKIAPGVLEARDHGISYRVTAEHAGGTWRFVASVLYIHGKRHGRKCLMPYASEFDARAWCQRVADREAAPPREFSDEVE